MTKVRSILIGPLMTDDAAKIEPPVGVLEPVRTVDETDEIMRAFREAPSIDERRPEGLPELSRWSQMEAMAKVLARSPMMPKHIRESRDAEADCMVTLLAAHDLGISATLAFQKVAVIDGKPTQYAELMRILAMRDGHKVWFKIVKDEHGRPISATCYVRRSDNTTATHAYKGLGDVSCEAVVGGELCGEPREHDVHFDEATFSVYDAAVAKLCTIDNNGDVQARSNAGKVLPWEAYTEDMLVARATSRAMRRACPESLGGVSYTPDELNAVVNEAAPTLTPSPESVRVAMQATIDELEPEVRAAIAAKWKEQGLGTLKPSRYGVLAMEHIDIAHALINEAVKATPVDAEIVPPPASSGPHHPFEGPTVDHDCVTCGNPFDHPLHVAGEPDVDEENDGVPYDSETGAPMTPPEVGVPSGAGVPTENTADPTDEAATEPVAVPGPAVPPVPPNPATAPNPGGSGPILDLVTAGKANRVAFVIVTRRSDAGPVASLVRVEYRVTKNPTAELPAGTPVRAAVGQVWPKAAGVAAESVADVVGVVRDDWVLGSEPF